LSNGILKKIITNICYRLEELLKNIDDPYKMKEFNEHLEKLNQQYNDNKNKEKIINTAKQLERLFDNPNSFYDLNEIYQKTEINNGDLFTMAYWYLNRENNYQMWIDYCKNKESISIRPKSYYSQEKK